MPSVALNEVTFLHHSTSDVEKRFVAQAHVQRHSVKSAMLLLNSKGNDKISLVQILIKDLDEIKRLHNASWNAEAEILLLGVQVNIYAFQIQQLPPDEEGSFAQLELESSRKILLHQGFNASVRLIHTFFELYAPTNRPESYASTEPFTLRSKILPKSYFILLMFATSFIFIFLVTNSEASTPDIETAHNHIRLTRLMLSSWSCDPMDEFGRAVRMIDVLSKAHSLSSLRLRETRVNDLRSLGLLEKVVFTAKEIRERCGRGMWCNFPISELQQRFSTSMMQDFTGFDTPEAMPNSGTASGLGMAFEGLQEFDWDAPWEFSMQTPNMPDSDFVAGLDGSTRIE